jgi:S-adenosylmethionine uptake transporter
MSQPRHDPIIAFLVAAFGIATFSAMDAVMKGLVLAIGTYTTLFWRSLAGMAIAGSLFAASKPRLPERRTMKIHAMRGLLGTVMAALFFWGLARVPMAQAIALAFVAPLMALYLAVAILKESVSPRLVGASLVAFSGVVIILFGQAQADLGREALLGSIAILASAGCYAVNIILMRQQSLAASPVEASFFQSLFMALGMMAAAPVLGVSPPPMDKVPMILLAAFLATTSLLLLSWAYGRAQASYLATTEYTSFLWAALFGWLFFRETVSPFTVAGAAMIIGGCLLAARTPEEADPSMEVAA